MTTRLSIGDRVSYDRCDKLHYGQIVEFNCYMSKRDTAWQTAAKLKKDEGGYTWVEVVNLTKDVTGILSHLPGSGFHVGDKVTYDDFKGNVVGFKADPEGDRAVVSVSKGDGDCLYPRLQHLKKVK